MAESNNPTAIVGNFVQPPFRLYKATTTREENRFDIDGSVRVRADEVKEIRVDNASSEVIYEGRAPVGSSESDPVWQIKRIFINGNVTETTFADLGEYSNAWSDRVSLFPIIGYILTEASEFLLTEASEKLVLEP